MKINCSVVYSIYPHVEADDLDACSAWDSHGTAAIICSFKYLY